MSTIKINELATASINLSDFFAKADANGLATKNTIQELATVIGTTGDVAFKGSLAIADTPSEDGWYFASESGTYTNAGSLVVDVSNNVVIIIVSGTQTVFEKVDIPISLTLDSVPTDASTNAVESNGIFDALALKTNVGEEPQESTIIFAANDSNAEDKLHADIVCTGTNDGTTINSALNGLTRAYKVIFKNGTYSINTNIADSLAYDGCVFEGCGSNTVLNHTSSGSVIFTSRNNIIVRDLNTNTQFNLTGTNCKVFNSFENGTYRNDKDSWVSKTPTFVVAAFDSSDEAKKSADYVAGSLNNGITQIINAINALPSDGGKIFLRKGTYQAVGFGIEINKNNITIEGEGKSTIINRDSGNDFFDNVGYTGTVLKNISVNQLNWASGSSYQLRSVWVQGTPVNNYASRSSSLVVAATDSLNDSKLTADYVGGIDEINTAIGVLNAIGGGKVSLMEGTYTGTSGINFNSVSNIILEGQGYNTFINRDSSTNSIFGTATNCIVKNIRFESVQKTSIFNFDFYNCYADLTGNGTRILDKSSFDAKKLKFEVSADSQFNKLSEVQDYIDSTIWTTSRVWEIDVKGHIVEDFISFQKSNINIYGKSAKIEFTNTDVLAGSVGRAGISFSNPSNTFYGTVLNNTIKDIEFLRTGDFDAWNFPSVAVSADGCKFINVKCNNQTGTAVLPSTISPSPDDLNGDRRHGLVIYEGESEFVNCEGIGSPNGFHNVRGIYIQGGSPTLKDCVGYGGGIGMLCHGIINHRSSNPILLNCIGYGGGNSGGFGIRFQGSSMAKLIGCVGFALDTNNDTTGVDTNAIYSGGLSLEYYGKPIITDCHGYQGNGINSYGLYIDNELSTSFGVRGVVDVDPIVEGGYFGVKPIIKKIPFVKEPGQSYMITSIETIPISFDNIGYFVGRPSNTDYVIITTLGGDTILNGKTETVNFPYFLTASQEVKIEFYDNTDTIITPDDNSFEIMVSYRSAQVGCYALKFDNDRGLVKNSVFRSNIKSDCIYIGDKSNGQDYKIINIDAECLDSTLNVVSCQTAHTNVAIYDSRLDGQLNNVTSFKTKNALLSSSNYN